MQSKLEPKVLDMPNLNTQRPLEDGAGQQPPHSPAEAPTYIGRYLFAGFFVIFALIGGVTVWAATQKIAGAVIASGRVVVDSHLKAVQHPTGGVVKKIFVKNGDQVEQNQILIQLDETVTRANLRVIEKQIVELSVRRLRLIAERDSQTSFAMPDDINIRTKVDTEQVLKGERELLRSRIESRIKQKQQLRERIAQNKQEIIGIEGQIKAKVIEIELIGEELEGLETLEAQKLITVNRMVSMRRQAARLEGEHGQLVASIARLRGQIAEVELQILNLDEEAQIRIVDELRTIESKISELSERQIAAQDQLDRIELRAPIAGVVHQLAVHTVGGVINSAEPVMMLVPSGDKLVIEARVSPRDIDRVYIGQLARIRFSAFNQRTTPELDGKIKNLSADLSQDERTGEPFFVARVAIPDAELDRLGSNNRLHPGMMADVQLKTQDRSALSFLVKPLEDQLSKAFRER